jgi:hypothetical protein
MALPVGGLSAIHSADIPARRPDQMPVILGPFDFDLCLDPVIQHTEAIRPLLRPCPETRRWPFSRSDVPSTVPRMTGQSTWLCRPAEPDKPTNLRPLRRR